MSSRANQIKNGVGRIGITSARLLRLPVLSYSYSDLTHGQAGRAFTLTMNGLVFTGWLHAISAIERTPLPFQNRLE